MDRLAGKTCLITGSTGIAAAAAMLFAAEGARIFVTSKTEAHCAELVDRLRATGAEAAYTAADLSDEAQAERRRRRLPRDLRADRWLARRRRWQRPALR